MFILQNFVKFHIYFHEILCIYFALHQKNFEKIWQEEEN